MSYELVKLIEELCRIADSDGLYEGGRHSVILLTKEEARRLRDELRSLCSVNR